MQTVMVILDGMQDIAYEVLGNQTPYDCGKGDTFHAIENASGTGYLVTTPPHFEADTQTCILTLLGVAPGDIPPGRSYIEALALGLSVGEEDIIMRCNFVEVDAEGRLAVPCCSAPPDVAKALRDTLSAMDDTTITPVGSYKSLQMIRGCRKYLDTITMSMPHQNAGKDFESLLPRGNALAERLADFSREQLKLYRPYTVFNWGQAAKGELPSFSGLHGGISGAMVSKTDAPMGIAVAMGMECPNLPTATGDTDTDLTAKVSATLDLANRQDLVMLHVGGPDEATHRQNPEEKAAFIKKLDTELMKPLLEGLDDGARVMLTCDHEALCKTAGHTDEPVKFWLYQKGSKSNHNYGTVNGTQAVKILLGKYSESTSIAR